METFCEDRSWDVFAKQLLGLLGLSCFLLAWVASTLRLWPLFITMSMKYPG